jgi:cyclase
MSFAIDELIILNASRHSKNILEFSKMIEQISQDVFIPVSAGGGIKSMQDAKILFNSGADKIVLNSVLWNNAELVKELVNQYGSQSIVAAVDYKKNNDADEIYVMNGTEKVNYTLNNYLSYLESLKVGEVYLNSMDRDGTGFGYDLETVSIMDKNISIPLIIAGGAGNENHLLEGLKMNHVDAVATANLFNFIGDGLQNARKKMIELKMNVASWGEILE